MEPRSATVELARLYPRWVCGGVLSPQVAYQVDQPIQVLRSLQGILWRGYLSDLFGTNYPTQTKPIQVTWCIWSYSRGVRLLIQSSFIGTERLSSATFLWPSAGWLEREMWEMFGLRVEGHPDLRRLLTDYGFKGFPLRKEFPQGGYLEVRYSERKKRVISKPVSFTQEFRVFDFVSPWDKQT